MILLLANNKTSIERYVVIDLKELIQYTKVAIENGRTIEVDLIRIELSYRSLWSTVIRLYGDRNTEAMPGPNAFVPNICTHHPKSTQFLRDMRYKYKLLDCGDEIHPPSMAHS